MDFDELASQGYRPEKGYTRQDIRRALKVIVVAWAFGAPFFSIIGGAAFTSFITEYLRADDFTYSLIMAAGPAAMVFLFLGSYAAERTGRVKGNFILFGTAHRLIWLVVAALPILLTGLPNGVKLALIGIVAFTSQAMANYGGAGWSTWVADIVPGNIAGRYFGFRAQIGMITMATVSTGVVYAVQRAGGKGWMYAAVFAIGAVLGATDILLFTRVREVPRATGEKPPSLREIFVIPWQHPLFRSFVTYSGAVGIAYSMMGAFTWRLCFDSVRQHGLGMSVLQAHVLLFIVPITAMAWAAPFWGQAIDRFGPRPVLAASAIMAIIFPSAWIFVRPSIVWLVWVAGILSGLTWPGIDQVNFYMLVKGFPDERRTAYNASFNFTMGIAALVGTTFSGLCASFWEHRLPHVTWAPSWMSHYQPVFITAILLRLLVWVLLFPRIRMDGRAQPAEVARAIATDMTRGVPGRRLWLRRRAARKLSK